MKVLVIVDMQKDFVDGALGTREAEAIVSNIITTIKDPQNSFDYIICTLDTHNFDYAFTLEGENIPEHCIEGSIGAALLPEIFTALRKQSCELSFVKKSTFGTLQIYDLIRNKVPKEFDVDLEIQMCGVCTDICVITNALILRTQFPEAKILINAYCCSGTTPENHEKALDIMKQCLIEVEE